MAAQFAQWQIRCCNIVKVNNSNSDNHSEYNVITIYCSLNKERKEVLMVILLYRVAF